MSTEKRHTLKGANLVHVDDKSHPNPAGRTALVAISVGAQYHEGDHLRAILMGIKKAGYKKVKILVGGYLQRHNYLRLLAIKQAGKEPLSAEQLYQGQKIHELSSQELEQFEKVISDKANEDASNKEKAWSQRYEAAIKEELTDAGIEVEVIEWEKQVENSPSYVAARQKVDAEFSKINGYQKFVNNAVDELRVIHLRECDHDSYGDALDTHREKFKQKDRDYILEETAVLINEQFQDCDFIYPMSQSRVSQLVVKGIRTVMTNQEIDIGLKFYSANFIPNKLQRQNKQRSAGEARTHNSDSDTSEDEGKVKSEPGSPKKNSDANLAGTIGLFKRGDNTRRLHSHSDPLPASQQNSSGVAAVVATRPHSDSTSPSQVVAVMGGSPPQDGLDIDGVNPLEEMALRHTLATVTLKSGASGPAKLKLLSTLFDATTPPVYYAGPAAIVEDASARHTVTNGRVGGGKG